MTSYKLTYFNAKGVAEGLRLLFKVAGKDFEDVRVQGEEWGTMKPNTPTQTLPILEVDGVVISQSGAISRFLAQSFGLYGKTTMEGFRIDEIQEMMAEMFQKNVFKFFGEKDEAKKKELFEKFLNEELGRYMTFFKKRLDENSTGFLVGSSVSLADIVVYRGLEMLGDVIAKIDKSKCAKLESYKEISDYCKKIAAIPQIAKWVKERPETEF